MTKNYAGILVLCYSFIAFLYSTVVFYASFNYKHFFQICSHFCQSHNSAYALLADKPNLKLTCAKPWLSILSGQISSKVTLFRPSSSNETNLKVLTQRSWKDTKLSNLTQLKVAKFLLHKQLWIQHTPWMTTINWQ